MPASTRKGVGLRAKEGGLNHAVFNPAAASLADRFRIYHPEDDAFLANIGAEDVARPEAVQQMRSAEQDAGDSVSVSDNRLRMPSSPKSEQALSSTLF